MGVVDVRGMVDMVYSLFHSVSTDRRRAIPSRVSYDEHGRRITRQTNVGGVLIGGGAPVVIQSMTGVKTSDIDATFKQCVELIEAGSQIVRIAVRDFADAAAVMPLKERLVRDGYPTPLVMCMHYNGHLLLEKHPECIEAADKFRINPGNVGFGDKWDDNCARFIRAINKYCDVNPAQRHKKALRVGVNWGSLDPALQTRVMDEMQGVDLNYIEAVALIISGITTINFAEALSFDPNQIVLSCKVSEANLMVLLNRCLSELTDCPLHLGVTEAGDGEAGIVSTVCGLAPLLHMGIGDTIRASLTERVGASRAKEVEVCKQVLQFLGMRSFKPYVNSCPGCGRAKGEQFKLLMAEVKDFVDANNSQWQVQYPGVENLRISVMGCMVNGPGESKKANIGFSLPGYGESAEEAIAVVYIDGVKSEVLRGQGSVFNQARDIIIKYIAQKYGSTASTAQVKELA